MSTPQGGESGQSRDADQQIGEPGPQWHSSTPSRGAVPSQGGAPGQGGAPAQGGMPGQGGVPAQGGVPGQEGQPAQGGVPAQGRGAPEQRADDLGGEERYAYPSETVTAPESAGPIHGRPVSPVNEIETRVTGRRVVQYIIDYIVTAVVASFIMWVFDQSSGAVNAVLLLIGAVLSAAWYFWYWVYRPYRANGQSFGMQLLGLRIISLTGGPASMMQLFVRGILLIVDTLFWGLVGFITMICSHYRQRVGDHAAKTLVVRARMRPVPAPREYAGAGRSGSR